MLNSGNFAGALQNHARAYNLPIDELNFCFNVVPVYRHQSAVWEELKGLPPGAELPMDAEVRSPAFLPFFIKARQQECEVMTFYFSLPHVQ